MLADDAALVEKIARTARSETGNNVVVDLADLDFLDSDAASILRRLAEREGFSIEGGEIFLQSAIDMAERVEADLT
jgi:anti-anti-sigma regulatory factor